MFNKNFVWGTATSSYQIEGAAYEDGRKASVWDVYCEEGDRVLDGSSGAAACDHYHKFKEDVALMAELGVKAYRFSISWSRIIPDGTGKVNEKGIDFYNRLIDELLKYNIEPYITLFHWDLPYELYKKGGYMNPDFEQWFADYAKLIVERFSDRVKYYFTFNEPQCFIGLGFLTGVHAPGLKSNKRDTFLMAHHMLKAHGRAVINMRKYAAGEIKIGYAPTCSMAYPETESEADIGAAKEYLFSSPDLNEWTWNVTWFSDPVFLGHYPEDGLKKYHDYLPEITEEDMILIHQPLDFMGENIYNGQMIRAGKDGRPEIVKRKTGSPKTAAQWPVTPQCLRFGPRFLYERYQLPLYITENGMSCHDAVALDGGVHDSDRITFLNDYLYQLNKAIEDGADIRGYFLWSLIDNFEWDKGYTERFGIVYNDFETQKRIIKDSGYWYKKVVETNGDSLIER